MAFFRQSCRMVWRLAKNPRCLCSLALAKPSGRKPAALDGSVGHFISHFEVVQTGFGYMEILLYVFHAFILDPLQAFLVVKQASDTLVRLALDQVQLEQAAQFPLELCFSAAVEVEPERLQRGQPL